MTPHRPARGASKFRTLASLVLAFHSLPVWAQDGGVVSDAPRALRMPNGSLAMNKPAADMLDTEMVRLQGVERQHKAESWVAVVMISIGVGLVAGAAVAVPLTLALTAPK